MDQVIAASLGGKTHVYRRNFVNQKWENVTNSNRTSQVRFLQRGGDGFIFKVTPEDNVTPAFERPLAKDNPVHTSGQGFIQVPLPDRQELYGIWFKDTHEGELFYAKIEAELKGHNVPLHTPIDLPNLPLSALMSEYQFPEPIVNQFDSANVRQSAALTMVNPPRRGAPAVNERGEGRLLPRAVQTEMHNSVPFASTHQHPTLQPSHIPSSTKQPSQPPPLHIPPSASHCQPFTIQPTHSPPSTMQPEMQPSAAVPIKPPLRTHKSLQVTVSPRPQQQDVRGMADILTSAINQRNREAAVSMIDFLSQVQPDRGRFKVVFDDSLDAVKKEPTFALELHIEFQASQRKPVSYFLTDVHENTTLHDLQSLVELQCRIPKATQNWIIGTQLVKSSDLQKTLRDFEITSLTGKAGTPQVHMFVANASKVKVVKEDSDLIRLRQHQQLQQHQAMQVASINHPQPGLQGYPTQMASGYAYDVPSSHGYQSSRQQPREDIPSEYVLQHSGQGGVPNDVTRGAPPPAADKVLPPPVFEKKQVGWECPTCTFVNRPHRPGCEQCTGGRPKDYIIPKDLALSEDDQRMMEEAKRNDQLFNQLQEQERDKEVVERKKNYQAMMKTEEDNIITNVTLFDCPICFTEIDPGDGVVLRNCLHHVCKECLHDHIMVGGGAEVKCPFNDGAYMCDVPIAERELRGVLSTQELEEVHGRALRQAENAAADSFHCRTPDCKGFCFYEDEVNEFDCPICMERNCLLCKAIHKGMNCQEYQDDLKRRAENDAAAKATQDILLEMINSGDAMNCPSCKIIIQKKEGCDWVMCSMCRTEICWATKGPRWGPKGPGDTSGGCQCTYEKKCHPLCGNCH